MYIQEIILDGFKSYAQKTVVSGFDPQFNAITGLNGTGKSNILDSICFVLGITNLSQVRVSNLQELVYKQGQAGISKATVSIVFNNADPANSPVGYESVKQITVSRQISVGGGNKYIINGATVKTSQVQDFFHSVQLNVNNPHFLIMQGRITKVLNMKPEEILSMIEEAAGTRMFETKKQAALKTIEKKQLRVDEITKCMDEEISPSLEGLQNERKVYEQWITNNSECERLGRLCTAYNYYEAEKKLQSSENDKSALLDQIKTLNDNIRETTHLADSCKVKISDIEKVRETEKEGPLQKLRNAELEVSKDLVQGKAVLDNKKESIDAEKETVASLIGQIQDNSASQIEKERELEECVAKLEKRDIDSKASGENLVTVRETYQNACAGVGNADSVGAMSLPEQVSMWEKRELEADSKLKQCQQRLKIAQEALKSLRNTNKAGQNAYQQQLKEKNLLVAEISKLEKQLDQISYSPAAETALKNRFNILRHEITNLQDSIYKLSASLDARLSFVFKDPVAGFDRSKVKGLVARLVRVNNSKAVTALEIAAGAKLYQVVVDSENTGKLLLQKGELKKRVTILPLNKINAFCTDPTKLQRAKSVAIARNGEANLALELVGYEKEMQKAMEYVFGSTIICDTSEIAKEIAFDKLIRNRTVTFDGDSFDPKGTITGGSKNSLGVLLSKIDELATAQDACAQKQQELSEVSAQLAACQQSGNAQQALLSNIDIKKHALKLSEENLSDGNFAATERQIAETEEEVKNIEKENTSLLEHKDVAKKELQKLNATEKDAKKLRENALKDMEKKLKACQAAHNELKNEVQKLRNSKISLTSELKGLKEESVSLQEQVKASNESIAKMQKEINVSEKKVEALTESYTRAKKAVEDKNRELNSCSNEIKELESQRDQHIKDIKKASTDLRKVKDELNQWEKNSAEAKKTVNDLMKNNSWIAEEKQYFGQSGGDFDFSAQDITACLKKHKELVKVQDNLSKNINKKAIPMMEKAEAEFTDLNRKRQAILKDKTKIEAVIEELDLKKSQALQATWIKVNQDFGSIFSTLLPGTHAKLEPPEGKTAMDGLEVKVAFNGEWKESLTELSGGQRSLLALSLILSLLLFKPAPMYILDEVDAALDLSHTQNIGMMLRTHFSNSQFIVVSLKEGMFNNANVIFRTKFVDGISAVVRTVAGGKARNVAAITAAASSTRKDAENNETRSETQTPQKKKGKKTTTVTVATALAMTPQFGVTV